MAGEDRTIDRRRFLASRWEVQLLPATELVGSGRFACARSDHTHRVVSDSERETVRRHRVAAGGRRTMDAVRGHATPEHRGSSRQRKPPSESVLQAGAAHAPKPLTVPGTVRGLTGGSVDEVGCPKVRIVRVHVAGAYVDKRIHFAI